MINVLLVDDHASVRKSLQYLLETTDDIRVAAAASTGFEALAHLNSTCPDVAIVDITMPLMDGIETARQIHARCQFTRVVMLSIHANPEYVQRAIEVGAFGYVLKEAIGKDLLPAIHAAHEGKRYFSQKLTEIANKYLPSKGMDSWAG